MLRYVILGKYSQDFSFGLIYNLQDSKKATVAMMKKAGAKCTVGESYSHINHPYYDFVGIVYSKDVAIIKAKGIFTEINF